MLTGVVVLNVSVRGVCMAADQIVQTVYAALGAFIFCAYMVYDVQVCPLCAVMADDDDG